MIRDKRKRNRAKREMENKIKRNRKAEMGEGKAGEEAMLYYDIIYSLLYIRFLISASSHDQISSLLS
jgi:hypothetical protein